MSFDRVRFFPRSDWGYGVGMEKIEILEIPDYNGITINDAIEYYQIKRYFDDGARVKSWTDAQYQEYKEKSKKLYGLCMRFFNALNDQTIIEQHEAVDTLYGSIFWELFESCKLYNTISDSVFEQLIQCEHIMPEDLFSYRSMVMKYGSLLRNYLINSGFGARILIHAYEQDYMIRTSTEKLFLPAELSGEDVCQILLQYIEDEKANLNDVLAIFRMKAKERFPVTDDIRLKAKRRFDEESQKILNDDKAIKVLYNLGVSIVSNQEELVVRNRKGWDIHISYSDKWFLETLDFPSILNNFIYLFEYADCLQMRCKLVSTQADSDFLERAMQKELTNIYLDNNSFHLRSGVSKMQMVAYCKFLKQHGIQYENVIKWFFSEYLQQEFGCSEIRAAFPSEGARYAEKCSTLCSTFDAVLKQFNAYVDYGHIDFDLISISSGSVKLTDVHSLVKKKYVYGTGEAFEWVTYMLFSDQSIVSYVERIHNMGRDYSTLYELLSHEEVLLSDYQDREIPAINQLSSYGVIKIEQNGRIILADMDKVYILLDLYKNDVISRQHLPKEIQPTIDEMINNGMLFEKDSLLSIPEINFYNYILNRVEYVNGLDLRNKYAHGIMQVNLDEAVHESNYYILLILFTILAIKINDDFCLREKQREDQNA